MTWLLCALAILAVSGAISWILGRHPALRDVAGVGGAIVGSSMALIPALRVLGGGRVGELRIPWAFPFGEFHLAIDPLSAWFLLPISLLAIAAAIYAIGYTRPWRERPGTGALWLFFNLLVASMLLVVCARNAILFLVVWELMALTSFFLVTFESERESVRQAGWIYLVAAHFGTAFLIAFFLLLGTETGSMDLARHAGQAAPASAGILFLLALVGFGTKAGFIPLHVWLPEAHPAAPSHVSALMSGVMIKTGIYGLLRVFPLLGPPAEWWAWTLVATGILSGIAGVLFALAQHDLKRLLAYHSVENIGIIAIGLGLGTLGICRDAPALAALGFAGALLHVLNHALFKGLLFLGAGSVLHGTGTGEIDRLGGLLRRMPWTGTTFLVGAAAICGLPPLNGFLSELLIFLGGYSGVASRDPTLAAGGCLALTALGLIGGLAVACFTKAFGIVFLGEPRSAQAARAQEAGWTLRLPMAALAAACAAVGLAGPLSVRPLSAVVPVAYTLETEHRIAEILAPSLDALAQVSLVALAFLALGALLLLARARLLSGKTVATSVTWDCGYARPDARMQYSASSFAQPITTLFADLLRPHREGPVPEEIFPPPSRFVTHTPDRFRDALFRPLFARLGILLANLRWVQEGRVQIYVLYVALTLLGLLLWKLA